jgi:hypothetical protein
MRSSSKVAILGVIVAAVTVATLFWNGYRAKADARKDAEDLRSTRARAEQGDVAAQFRLALMYHQGILVPENDAEELRWLLKAATQGDAKSEYAIGYMYDTGQGVQQNPAEALSWYEKAADQGDRRAQLAIGSLHYDGRGVQQDRPQAAVWYRRAADRGLPRAQYDLGYMYYYGQGVKQDRVEANRWFRQALEHGDEHARQALGFKLTMRRIAFLVLQSLLGFALAFRPLSLNIWERNERPRDFRAWLSIVVGLACLIDAAMGWWGYTHNLFWSWTYGTTGFMLFKAILNVVVCVLLLVLVLKWAKASSESGTLIVPVE